MGGFLDLLNRNKMFLVLLAILASQIVTWRAVVDVAREVDHVYMGQGRHACGGTGDRACKVVIIPP